VAPAAPGAREKRSQSLRQANGRTVVDVHAGEARQQGLGSRFVVGRGLTGHGVESLGKQGPEEDSSGRGETLVQSRRANGHPEVGSQLGQVGQGSGGIVQPTEDGDLREGGSGKFASAADEVGVGSELVGVVGEKGLQSGGEVG